MRAIVLSGFGGVDNFRLAELPIPPLRSGEVRIRVESVSFNPVDCQIRKGLPESREIGSPILGRDLSGVIDAVHDDVTGFRPGDAVYSYVCKLASSGTYAEYVSVPAELVAKKPLRLTHGQAAAVPVAGITANLALADSRVDAASSLFIASGAGGVGSFAIMLARQFGVRRLFTTAGNAKSRDYLIDTCGLRESQVVDYRDADFVAQAIAKNGAPFDVVLDLVGGAMLSACCKLLAVDGRLASATEAPSRDDFEYLFEKNATFHAVGAHARSLTGDRRQWRKCRGVLTQLATLFDSDALPPPHVTRVGSLSVETVRHAHELLDLGGMQGKLVMSCR